MTHDSTPPAPASALWWAVPAVGLLLLSVIASLFGGPDGVGHGTSYDASDRGFRGAYLVLKELGYPVARSRLLTGGEVRWVLPPARLSAKESAALADWVSAGGLLLLAPHDDELPGRLGLTVAVERALRDRERPAARPARAPDVATLVVGFAEVTGPPCDRSWGEVDGKPLVSVYPRGRGAVWLMHRPDLFANAHLREADNAVLVCRLAEAMLRERGGGTLAFDEYAHGLRDRPSAGELLFRPPVLGVTLQLLLLGAVALWHFGTRFGAVHADPAAPRRSKEEFLEALAELLARNGDCAAAFRTVRAALVRRLEESLGLATGTPVERTVGELARRRGVDPDPLLRLLSADHPPAGRGVGAFLDAIRQLDAAAHECLPSRRRDR
jgi:hypothetical protein